MLQLPRKFGESICNPYWLTVLRSSSDSNYVPNEHEDPESLVNQNEIPVDLSY